MIKIRWEYTCNAHARVVGKAREEMQVDGDVMFRGNAGWKRNFLLASVIHLDKIPIPLFITSYTRCPNYIRLLRTVYVHSSILDTYCTMKPFLSLRDGTDTEKYIVQLQRLKRNGLISDHLPGVHNDNDPNGACSKVICSYPSLTTSSQSSIPDSVLL